MKVGKSEWLFANETPRSRSSARFGAVSESTLPDRKPSGMKTIRLFGRLPAVPLNPAVRTKVRMIPEATRLKLGIVPPSSDHFKRFVLSGRREYRVNETKIIGCQFPTRSSRILADVIDVACLRYREQAFPTG